MTTRVGTLLTRAKTEGFEEARAEIRGYGTELGRAENASDNFNRTGRATAGTVGDIRAGTVLAAAGFALLTRQVISAGREASTLAVEYDRALTEVTTLLSGGADQTERLREETLRLSTLYSSGAAEQARSYYNIVSAGIMAGADANNLLDNANILATASITGLETATQLLTGTFNAFAPQGTMVAEIMDVLFATVENGIINMQQLARALPVVSAVAANLGISLVDISAGLAALTSTGILPQIAATQLRSLTLGFQRLTEDQREVARSLGVTSFAAQDYIQTIGQLRNGLNDLGSDQERNARLFEIFGTNQEQYNAVLALTGGGYESLISSQDRLTNSTGAAQTAYEKVADSISNQLLIENNRLEASNIRLGTQINQVLVPALRLKADAYEFAADNAGALAGILTGSLVTVAIPVAVAAFRTLATTVGFATFGVSTVLGAIAAFSTAVIIDELTKVEVSADDLEQAVNDVNEAYGTFVDSGSEASLRQLLKLAEGHAMATLEARKQALAQVELIRLQSLTALGADPRTQERFDRATEAAEKATAAAAEAEIRLIGYRTELDNLAPPLTKAEERQQKLAFSLETFLGTATLVNPAVNDYTDNLLDNGVAVGRTEEETAELNKTLTAFLTTAGTVSDANGVLGDSFIETKEAAVEARETAQEFSDFLVGEYENSIRGVGDAIGQVAIGGIDNWRDFETAVTNSAKQAVANIIAEFTSTQLLNALRNVGNLITGAGGATAGAVGAGAGAGVGGAAGAGIGASIGAALLPLAGLGAIVGGLGLVFSNLFDQGSPTDIANFDIDDSGSISGATNTRTRRNNIIRRAISGETYTSATSALGAGAVAGLQEVALLAQDAVTESAALIGGEVGSFATNQFRDLTTAQLANVDQIARDYAETLARSVSGVPDLIRDGETAVGAIDRLSGALTALNVSAEALGLTTLDLSVANAGASQEIIDLVGGLENLMAGQQGLFQFLSPEQQASQLGMLASGLLGFDLNNGQQLIDRNAEDARILNDPNSSQAARDRAVASQGVLLNTDNQQLFAAVLGNIDRDNSSYTDSGDTRCTERDFIG